MEEVGDDQYEESGGEEAPQPEPGWLRPRPPKTALIEMSGGVDEHVGASVEE